MRQDIIAPKNTAPNCCVRQYLYADATCPARQTEFCALRTSSGHVQRALCETRPVPLSVSLYLDETAAAGNDRCREFRRDFCCQRKHGCAAWQERCTDSTRDRKSTRLNSSH